ncbi:MAG: serine hydrolase domain-containing protein [Bacteroidota bacterium]
MLIRACALLACCLLVSSPLQAQDGGAAALTDAEAAQIDALFAPWATDHTPGWAVGVVRDGVLVFAKGYGLANLEHGVPITPRSVFYMASASKQVAAACAAVLVQQGRLALDADIRAYLPELPDYGVPVTVGDLLYHTSGIREYTSLQLFAGLDPDFEVAYTNDDLVRLAADQRALNFEPGTAFRYSSLNYVLLTELIERLTGTTLDAFARTHLFAPLGMDDTQFDMDHHQVVPGRVQAYRQRGDGYERYTKTFDAYGDGGLLTTVEDLARWDAAFYAPLVGAPGWAALMTTEGTLRRGPHAGAPVGYAMGLQFRDVYGRRAVEHNGGMLGFTVDLVRFPEERLSVIVLGNHFAAWSTALAYQVAGFLLEELPASPSTPPPTVAPAAELAAYAGRYESTARNFYRRLVIAPDGTLRFDWGDGDGSSGERVYPVAPHQFVIPARTDGWWHAPAQTLTVDLEAGTLAWTQGEGRPLVLERYDPTPPRELADVRDLVGTYHSPELHATYRLFIEADTLHLQVNQQAPRRLFPDPAPGVIWNARNRVWIGVGQVRVLRDAAGQVTALQIGDRRVDGVRFERQSVRASGRR